VVRGIAKTCFSNSRGIAMGRELERSRARRTMRESVCRPAAARAAQAPCGSDTETGSPSSLSSSATFFIEKDASTLPCAAASSHSRSGAWELATPSQPPFSPSG
jgi:hypothetical protein